MYAPTIVKEWDEAKDAVRRPTADRIATARVVAEAVALVESIRMQDHRLDVSLAALERLRLAVEAL